MGKPNRQTALLLAAGILAVVFSLGFFAGRNTVTYEVAAQTERTASQAAQAAPSSEEEAKTNAEAADEEADGILDYRAEYGRFSAPEQLMDVDGIGEATFDGLRELVTVEDTE